MNPHCRIGWVKLKGISHSFYVPGVLYADGFTRAFTTTAPYRYAVKDRSPNWECGVVEGDSGLD